MKLLICTQAVDVNDPVLGFFARWIEEFAKRCETVTVVTLRVGEHQLPSNVEVVVLRSSSRIGRTVQLWQISIAREYDAVFVHMNPEYLVSAGLLWRLLGKCTALWYTHKSVNLRLRIGTLLANTIFTASAESFRLASSKTHVMGHGIDTERPLPPHVRSENVRLMTSGRVSRVKGLEVIIDAYLALKHEEHVTLSIYGAPVTEEDEVYATELRERLSCAGEDPSAVLKGAVPHAQMPAVRASADYFLHASETGSLDKAVLDAILSGLIPLSSSEAYGDLFAGLEPLLIYPKGDALALADRVSALTARSASERAEIRSTLIERVRVTHSLQNLVPAVLRGLETV